MPSGWSSEDWDGDKAKGREQHSLIDFNQLERQLTQTLQKSTQDASLETLRGKTPDKKLTDDFQAMMLKEGDNRQDLPNNQTDKLEVPDDNNKEEEERHKSPAPKYVMMEQEKRMQEKEEKYNIYISTIGYEGDDLGLDLETDSESEGQAYPFLD